VRVRVRVGYKITYDFPQPTPMIALLNVHYSRASDLVHPDTMLTTPATPISSYRDGFGNWCNRMVAPAGTFTITADTLVRDNGALDELGTTAEQHAIEDLPDDTLVYLLGSRYCETDRLIGVAWDMFGGLQPGWPVVEAINDYVHNHITFGYQWARPTMTAWEAYDEGHGVCRDYAHLGVALCRAMNIPARYVFGYLPEIEVEAKDAPMDFAAWMQVWLGDRWYTFDPRNNVPRKGRVLIGVGRDAADVAMSTAFGAPWLESMVVVAEEATT
jgi:transglutaminase-like putative cysteine protease